MKEKIVSSGKRKTAVARAVVESGKGNVFVNGIKLDFFQPELARMKMQEPLIIAGSVAKKYDIHVKVIGGGIMSQADAARLAIAKGLVMAENGLEKSFLEYDRNLLVADVRRKETRKPNDSKARAKRQKSYR